MDALTPAGAILAAEIAASGSIPFSRFMEVALYHPVHGYYRRSRDPFGARGDFYTAEQMQPVFGRLIAAAIRALREQLPGDGFRVVELGAGRREMEHALAGLAYTPVDLAYGELPESFRGVVFTNEFFDAVPVDLIRRTPQGWVERRVAFEDGRFVWNDSLPSADSCDDPVEIRETQSHRLAWLERVASRLAEGFLLTIDYGYTRRELVRFPQGTLMSYRRHRAVEDVLQCPGEQDITAHVDFTALEERGRSLGLSTVGFESLASFLLRAGEGDHFASALVAENPTEEHRYRMQLKTLLFGMGETFRVLIQRK